MALILSVAQVASSEKKDDLEEGAAAAGVVSPLAVPAEEASSLVKELNLTTEHVEALLEGTLPTDVTPESLFDIDIHQERRVLLETRRLAELLNVSLDELPSVAPSVPEAPKPKGEASTNVQAPLKVESPVVDAPAPAGVDPAEWKARRELDVARLSFYRLGPDERKKLLKQHASLKAQAEKEAAEANASLSGAEKAAAEASREKEVALLAAKNARTEAERAMHAEVARLLGVAKEQAEFEQSLSEKRKEAAHNHDSALKMRREISSEVQEREGKEPDGHSMDARYVQLRSRLKVARSELSSAIDVMSSGTQSVPRAGADRLSHLAEEFDRGEVISAREKLEKRASELAELDASAKEEEARLLMAEVEMLNRLRLETIAHLSPEKRSEIRGFTTDGFKQARSELRQVLLTIRYHLHATKSWAKALKAGSGRTESALTATLVAIRWLLPVGLFIWWRRRSEAFLLARLAGARAEHRHQVGQLNSVQWDVRIWSFLLRIHRPLERLLLVWGVFSFLPISVQGLLEVELLWTILSWSFGGMLAVTALDALGASGPITGPVRIRASSEAPQLRYRSLLLVGRTVVAFGLILALTDKLVGEGTIHSWVFSTCWMAAAPVFLQIVSWWRPEIYSRLETIRKKRPIEIWVLDQRQGASSFVGAIVGGVLLFSSGIARTLRAWLVTFTLVRRVLAYLFRRGMNKKAVEQGVRLNRLGEPQYSGLSPEVRSEEIVASVADEQVEAVITQIRGSGGGVYAVVGERGAGKTTVLERIAEGDKDATYVQCPAADATAFKEALNRALGLDKDAAFDEAAARLEEGAEDPAVLIDDAHHLILPMMGGLADFDSVLDLARRTSSRCTWIFAVDQALWRFLERARGAKPLFDDAIHLASWSEAGISRLLQDRNRRLGLTPSFQDLLVDFPADADATDLKEALERTEAAYFRLLWDYADGNPGVALHFWRESLGVDEEDQVRVQLFNGPEAEALEGLPDSAVFVLRAIVQLGVATTEQVCNATALPHVQVKDALRYGVSKGYFVQEGTQFQITWTWFRAITRFLKRRHLLFGR